MYRLNVLKRFGLLTVGIFIFHISFSQINYLPGEIIDNQGDTLKGFIDYKDWKNNPEEIKYKSNMEESPRRFTPADILGFRVHNAVYVSAIVDTEVSPRKTIELTEESELQIKVDTIFLQMLIDGKKSLYYYNPEGGKDNFYINDGSKFELLVYKRYIKIQEGKRVIKESKKYLGQLSLYLNDCPDIQSRLNNTNYNENSLINLFQNYYKWTSSGQYFQKKADKITPQFGVLAGVSGTNLSFASDNEGFNYLEKASYNFSTNFSTGIFMDLILARNHGKWSVYNELLFSTYDIKGKFEQIDNPNKFVITTTEFGYSYLKLNNLLRYKHPIGHSFIFINGGLSNGIVLKETNYRKILSNHYSTVRIEEGKAIPYSRRYEQDLLIGTGIKHKAFSFEVRFDRGTGISPSTLLSSYTTRCYLLFGYKF